MRAECFDEAKRTVRNLRVEIQATLVSVLQIVQVPHYGKPDVPTGNYLTSQDGYTVSLNALRMITHRIQIESAERIERIGGLRLNIDPRAASRSQSELRQVFIERSAELIHHAAKRI